MMVDYSSHVKTFLEFIFSGIEDRQYFLIWTLQDKASKFFDNIEEATQYIHTVKNSMDVYYGVGLHGVVRSRGRGAAAAIVGIPSIWADIDIHDQVHSKDNLPPSVDAVMEVISGIPWRPSVIVHSGHGLQANWKFREVFRINDDADRVVINRLVQRFQNFLRGLLQAKGWTMDATHDLARVMRIPGTFNRKREPVIPTSILQLNRDIEYNPSDFDDLPTSDTTESARIYSGVNLQEITLDGNANPDSDKFKALLEADLLFARTWDHDRPDFPAGDQSQSAYDMSLATRAAMAEWEPQEIVNLVIANRRKYGSDLKLRYDYYKGLLDKAYASAIQHREERELEKEIDGDGTEVAQNATDYTPPTIEEREALWSLLSKLWGVRVLRVVRTLGDPVRWRIEVSIDGQTVRVELGDAGFVSQTHLQKMLQNKAKVFINSEKPKRWTKIAQRIVRCAIDEDLGIEMSDEGLIRDWLMQYLETRPPCPEDSDNFEQSVMNQQPFIKKDKVRFFIDVFGEWVSTMKRSRIDRKNLAHMLSLIECKPETVHVKIKNRDTTRRAHAISVHVWNALRGDHTTTPSPREQSILDLDIPEHAFSEVN